MTEPRKTAHHPVMGRGARTDKDGPLSLPERAVRQCRDRTADLDATAARTPSRRSRTDRRLHARQARRRFVA